MARIFAWPVLPRVKTNSITKTIRALRSRPSGTETLTLTGYDNCDRHATRRSTGRLSEIVLGIMTQAATLPASARQRVWTP